MQFLDAAGQATQELAAGEPATILLRYEARQCILDPVFGVAIFRRDGLHLAGENTRLSHFTIPQIDGAGQVRYGIKALPLWEGEYYLSVAIHTADEREAFDYQDLAYTFRVSRAVGGGGDGVVYVPATWDHVPQAVEEVEGTKDDS